MPSDKNHISKAYTGTCNWSADIQLTSSSFVLDATTAFVPVSEASER